MVSVVAEIAIALSVAAIVELLLDMLTSLMALFYRVPPVMADIMAITELLMARSQAAAEVTWMTRDDVDRPPVVIAMPMAIVMAVVVAVVVAMIVPVSVMAKRAMAVWISEGEVHT